MPTRRFRVLASIVFASTLFAALLLNGSIPFVATGSWQSSDSMATARGGATATLLQDGRVLLAGGSDANGPLSSVETYSSGNFSSVAEMGSERKDHAAVLLESGAVLVAGGITSTGSATNSAEIYQPGSASWSPAGSMSDARSGHTATLLGDGRVLIAGGESSGGVLSTVEIYDPSSNSFSHAGTMSTPRSHHAAARLADGRVLLIGGTDGNQALASTDIFNPNTDSISSGPNMSMARISASATELNDQRMLVVGGNNGSADLASAETYSNGDFSSAGDSMSTPRSGHVALLLGDNNAVLIAGGSSGGSPVASAEIYYPWSRNFVGTGSMSVGRANAAGSELNAAGRLLVVGGNGQAGSEVYGFATLATDQDEYSPGEVVTVAGKGWQPGESVTLTFHETDGPDPDQVITATADSSGNITNSDFSPDQNDIGINFSLTAKDSRSQAQVTFKDGANDSLDGTPNNYSLTLHPGDPIPSGTTFTYSISQGTNANKRVTFPVTGTVAYTGAFGSADKTSVTMTSYTSLQTVTVSGTVPCSQATGNVSLQVKVDFPNSGNSANLSPNQQTSNVNITVANPAAASCDSSAPDTTITAKPNDPTNAATATFSFTGSDNLTPPASLTFECKLDNAAFATCGSPIIFNGPLAAGSHTFQVRAKDQAGNFDPTPAIFTWTVDTAPPDTTITSGTPSGNAPTFTFAGTDNVTPAANLSFECSLENAAFAACTTPKSYSGLSGGSHTFQVRAKDAAGNVDATPSSVTWSTDTTAPVITPNITGTLGSSGWYTSDVNVTWSVVENESDIASSTGCTASSVNTDTSGKTFSCSATSSGGTATQSVTIKRDGSAPVLMLDFTPDTPDGNNGWWKTPGGVGFKWTCSDAGSGIDASFNDGCPAVLSGTVSAQGVTNFTRQVKDQAGNLSVIVDRSVKLDNIAPTIEAAISPAAPATTGWYNIATGAPTVSFTCSDAGSGVVGACPADVHVADGENQTVSRTVPDQAGNTATASKNGVNVDTSAPVLTLALTPDTPDGDNGWWKTPGGVGFAWTCSDATSGIAPADPCPTSLTGIITDQGTTALNRQVKDVAGNSSAVVDRSIKLDNVAPTITASITPINPATTGWYNVATGAPTVSFACSDATSGLAGTCPANENLKDGANQDMSRETSDRAGNKASNPKTSINVDVTAPTLGLLLTPDAPDGDNGWWKTAGGVGFGWTCSDTTSGVDPSFAGGCPTPSAGTITAQGTTNFADQVRDVAGNPSVSVNRSMRFDNVAPVINISAPLALTLPQGYVLNAALKSGYTCTDVTSGASSCAGTLPSGSNFDTSGSDFDAAGAGINKSFTVNAKDQAGNAAVQTNNYNVIYASGLACLGSAGHSILQPINPDGSSVFKQGSTVPAKFRVCDANGLSIGALGTVSNFRLTQAASGTLTAVDESVDSTTPDTIFRWDPTAQQWIFNVTTKPLHANVTYYYSIYLNDGTNIPFLYGLK